MKNEEWQQWQQYLEDKFFLMYHLKMDIKMIHSLSNEDRKWIIDKFIEEKNNGKR